jgi:hypothetical protein
VAGQFGDLRFELVDRQPAVRSVLAGILEGVFHGRTDTVFIYSMVANSQLFSSAKSMKMPENIDQIRVPSAPPTGRDRER